MTTRQKWVMKGCGVVAAVLLGVMVSKVARADDVKVGDFVAFRIACKTEALITRQLAIVRDHGYDAVQSQFALDVKAQECVSLPSFVEAPIDEIGASFTFVDDDGDLMTYTAVRVKKAWTVNAVNNGKGA